MRLAELVSALALNFRTSPGRITNIASRLQDAGLIRKTEGSRRYPDDASPAEIVALFIAAIAETGLGTADQSATTFAELKAPDGVRLDVAINDVLFGEVPEADIAIRLVPPGASVTIGDTTVIFGAPATDGTSLTRFVPASATAGLRAALTEKETA